MSDTEATTPSADDDNALVELFKRRQHNAAIRSLLATADGLAALAAGHHDEAVMCFVESIKERDLAAAYAPEIEAARRA